MDLCGRAGVGFQKFLIRSDLSCGSTIGPGLSAQLGVETVDMGNAIWAMHSIRETTGMEDIGRAIAVFSELFR
jgi:aspartyl aminopeptidase